jgi:hypothetical protein
MTQFPEMDDPELQELLDLEAAERGEAGFVAANPGGADFDDPDLAELMAMEEADQLRQPGPQPPDPKRPRWRRGR